MMELDVKMMGGDVVGFIVMGTFWFLYFIYLKLFKKQDSSTGSGKSHGESSQENTSSVVDQLTEMIRSGQREEAIELFQSAAKISREEAIREIDELEQLR